jgi:hypothetical protein
VVSVERTHKGRLVIYERPDETWGWRLESEHRRIIAVGDSCFATAKAANAEATRIIFGEYADVQVARERREA